MKNTHKFLSILFAVVVIAAFVVVPVGASDGTPPDPAVFDVGLIVQLLQGLALAIFPVLAVQAARWANAQIALVRSKMTAEQEAHAEFIAEAFNVHHETGLSPRELLEQRDNLLEWLDTLTLVVGLTPIAGNKEALQEAMNGARAAIAATRPQMEGGE